MLAIFKASLSFQKLLVILLCAFLSLSLSACTVLGNAPSSSAPASTAHPIDEPPCSQGAEKENWKISASKQKMTVAHNFQQEHESCERPDDRDIAKKPQTIKSSRDGSLHDLLSDGGVTAKVHLVLDPTPNDRDHSSVEFKAI